MPTFTDEIHVPDTVASLESDAIPVVSDVEYPCKICGKEAGPYGGRGRKPTKCDEHKKAQSTGTRAPRVTGSNDMLARQATEALCSIDGFMSLGARMIGFTDTAEVIEEADEVFRLRVHTALLNNPDTARKILRYGSKAGDTALFIAIALHVATIAPVFMMEAKTRKALKAEERARLEESNN